MKILLSRRAEKVLRKLHPKIYRQVQEKIVRLAHEGLKSADIKPLKGFHGLWRADSGEYRIIFRIDGDALMISLIGKRNDDEIYRELERMLF